MLNQHTTTTQKIKVVVPLVLVFVLIVFISAWLCDDSFITFRTIKNFVNGHGLTWNISERVQTYTHPLWMFIISGFYFITREVYFTSITFSILISAATVFLLLYKLSDSLFNSILASLILIFSKAFIDYSTSGLENPLTHLLIVIFFIVFFSKDNGNKKLFLLSCIASFSILNRMDTILLLLPALVVTYFKGNKLRGLLAVTMGFFPFIVWEIFSLFYYGFPFPNTAYAKLNTGVDQIELIQQGFQYFVFSIYLDPITPIIIILGVSIAFLMKNRNLLTISVGIIVYLVYILNIGGDFMGGRFFSAPLICAVIIISKTNFSFHEKLMFQITILLGIVILGFLSPRPTVLTTSNYGLGPKIVKAFRFGPDLVNIYRGIVDERIWYYNNTGLLNNILEQQIGDHLWVRYALQLNEDNNQVIVKDVIGLIGYYADENIHFIDPLAITEPLLSKSPSTEYWRYNWRTKEYRSYDSKKWRIGHFARKIPDGYIETITIGENKIQNRSLSKYYDKLSFVIKGDLFDLNRIAEIWNLNFGKYNYLLNAYNKTLTSK
jgi:arabinofuranosyltransferase